MRSTFSGLLFILLAGAGCAAPLMTTASVECRYPDSRETLELFWDGARLRIEQPSRRFGILYDTKTGDLVGLEERDAYYWKFNWPEVAAAVRKQRRGQNILDENLPGFPAASRQGGDDGRWLWHFEGGDGKEKTWEAAGEGTRAVEAHIPFLNKADPQAGAKLALWKRFALVSDVVRLVAMREVAPDGIEPLFNSLPADAGCPAALTWMEHGSARNTMALAEFRADAPLKASRFEIPKSYRITDLDALDGILKEAAPPPEPIKGENLAPYNTGEELMPTP
ncbi:MAG: hypothetical protein PW734_10830 [Verrucomicrobium sp.]|nr:hypothetical protein [Verrucomicrobium sp.]